MVIVRGWCLGGLWYLSWFGCGLVGRDERCSGVVFRIGCDARVDYSTRGRKD
jgi:hypothetical protein